MSRWAIGILTGALALAFACGATAQTLPLRERVAAAAPGERLVVPAGVHEGRIRIDKPLTLAGEPGAIIDGGGEGDVLTVTAPDVTITGLVIRNTGKSLDRENAGVTVTADRATIENNRFEDVLFGVYLKESNDSRIVGNFIGGKALDLGRRGDAIRLWQCRDTLVADNRVRDSRDCVLWFSDGTRVLRNVVTGGRYGLHFMYSDGNVLEGNVCRSNSVGAFLMYSKDLTLLDNRFVDNRGPSGYGLGMKEVDDVEARGNVFAGNRIGVNLDNAPASLDAINRFEGNVFAFNDAAMALMPNVQRNRFTRNAFIDNTQQVTINGGGGIEGNEFAADGEGNYWSDYQGFDLDGDGVGDIPHRSMSLFEDLLDQRPKLRLFLYSPAQQAVDMAARVAPVVAPSPKFVDPFPLMKPPVENAAPPSEGAPRLALAGLGMMALGLAGAGLALAADSAAARRIEKQEAAR